PSLKILNRKPTYNKQPGLLGSIPSGSDSCSVYKVSMNQELFYQYVEYQTKLPNLKEFTLCLWTKFHNHTEDHPLFSYAGLGAVIWSLSSNKKKLVACKAGIRAKVLRDNDFECWYHSCQSWNGKTGEWQIWVNAERVGRGFHNRLVGHVIKGGGTIVSGQEQSLLYTKDGSEPILKQSGLIGEITMLQLYNVALTAGKAHRDHKHHHAHHFKHDGTALEASTQAATEPPPPQATPIGNGNFLIGGQLQRPANLNLARPTQQTVPVQLPNGIQLQQEYANGQFGNRLVSEQLLNHIQPVSTLNQINGNIPSPSIPVAGLTVSQIGQGQRYETRPFGQSKGTSVVLSGSLINPANVQYIDDTSGHNVFKRDSKKRDKRDNPEIELAEELSGARKDKRGLVALSDGSIVDEALLSSDLLDETDDDVLFQQSLLDGLAGVVGNLPVQNLQRASVDDREPAEAEVKAVMQVCSGCTPEPFKKALVLSWRSTSKKLFSGAHYYKGLPICRAF
ncbi:jg25263, partial [Pararge aegeria aegeria]